MYSAKASAYQILPIYFSDIVRDMRNVTCGSLFLLALSIPCCVGNNHRSTSKMADDYVPFPPEIEPLLKNKTARLAPISPLVTVISTVPEIDNNNIWHHLMRPAIRNGDIMKVHANYV